MISQKSSQHQPGIFATPPPKKRIESRSIMRKPSLVSFNKKKPSEITEIRSSDRIRFISPTRANLTITEDMIDSQNSIQLNYTQYPSNQQINYPFIKKCASPKNYDNCSISRRSSFYHDGIKQDSAFLSRLLQPSIQEFGSCQFDTSPIKNKCDKLEEEISILKKTNIELNQQLKERNQFIQKQKIEYDGRLMELTRELMEINNGIQISENKMLQTEQKMLSYQARVKQLQDKLLQTNEKLDKADKEIKMYKAKYRINFNNPKLTEEMKSRKYHNKCCSKGYDNNENNCKSNKNTESNLSIQVNQNKSNILLKESNKKSSNNLQQQEWSLKKIKSQTILGLGLKENSLPYELSSPQASNWNKIHCNQQQYNEYISMRRDIENLTKEIRYKEIEILTLKKTKSEYEKEKEGFEKVKRMNKRLLQRVEYLTKECENGPTKQMNKNNRHRSSLPIQMTPVKGKFKNQYQQFNQSSSQQQQQQSSSQSKCNPNPNKKNLKKESLQRLQIVQFELSPQKDYQREDILVGDMVFEMIEGLR